MKSCVLGFLLSTRIVSESFIKRYSFIISRSPSLIYSFKSLRMKLVWHFCPKTRNVASILALNNGYLSKIIEKDEDNKELSKQEEVVLKTYNRSVWNNAVRSLYS